MRGAAARAEVLDRTFAEVLADLPAEECERLDAAIRYRWAAWARPKQRPPEGDWDVLGLVAGKGGGKTRPGAEFIRYRAERFPGIRMALVGRTARDTRDTMVLGESGVIAVCPPWNRPKYKPSKSLVQWSNGSEAHLYSADKPDQLRGPQHSAGWGDEFSAWKEAEALSNLEDGLRLMTHGHPQLALTTTPRRTDLTRDTFLGPRDRTTGLRPVTREMVASGAWEFIQTIRDLTTGLPVELRTIVRRWSTEENSRNLAAGYVAKRRAAYGGSSLGRQELDADFLEDVEGALWNLTQIDNLRVSECPRLVRLVVCVDPSFADDGGGDACGIVVVGLSENGRGYVLKDRSMNGKPEAWGKRVVSTYNDVRADLVVYEGNTTPDRPDVVRDVIKIVDPKGVIKWHSIHSSRDKRTRADPVSALYGDEKGEGGRVHHVVTEDDKPDHLSLLEDEMTTWEPTNPKSPNRLDALVHGLSYLMLGPQGDPIAPAISVGERASPWRV